MADKSRVWKNVELTNEEADKFRLFLHDNGICFESSGCFNIVHFEVNCNADETHRINAFLDTL